MRRRLEIYFPAFLMALMMQIIAPIGASWATAASLSDPLAAFGGAVICHGATAETDSKSDQTGHGAHAGACALCCLVQAGAALDMPQIVAAAAYRSSSPVVWSDAVQEFRNFPGNRQARARAPPSNS